jgi:hypothetical protein
MDDRAVVLREKLAALLNEAAQLEVELSRVEGAVGALTHYSVIELRAHELGRSLSRNVQQWQMRETAATASPRARCPACRTICELEGHQRDVTSVDGPFAMLELKGHCPSCRRDFFPSSGSIGV